MVTTAERAEMSELAARMTGEAGIEGLREEDQAVIADALSRLPDPELEDARWSIKPPTVTRMTWWY